MIISGGIDFRISLITSFVIGAITLVMVMSRMIIMNMKDIRILPTSVMHQMIRETRSSEVG